MVNPLIFVDLPTPDPEATSQFYETLFDWKYKRRPAGEFHEVLPGVKPNLGIHLENNAGHGAGASHLRDGVRPAREAGRSDRNGCDQDVGRVLLGGVRRPPRRVPRPVGQRGGAVAQQGHLRARIGLGEERLSPKFGWRLPPQGPQPSTCSTENSTLLPSGSLMRQM